jgi:hypothetical protein
VLLDIRQILANMQAEENKDGDSNRT